MKRLLSVVVMILCGMVIMAQTNVKEHIVNSGETLYSISRQYGVTVNDIINANPGMTETIIAGQTIKVPTVSSNPELKKLSPCKTTHIVQKKETIYGISHQYGITEEELIAANMGVKGISEGKLKKGVELCIPYSNQEKEAHHQKQVKTMEQIEEKRQEAQVKYYDVIKIAVIAPFGLSDARRSSEAKKMTDFYRGFLMAVDTLKHKGISCDIYTYEELGSDGSSVAGLTSQPMLKNVNIIVGPMRPANAAQIAKFAAENNILMVTPMSTKTYDLSRYKNVFEVSSPQSFVYENVYSKFISKYSGKNIIFAEMNDSKDNATFISRFKQALDNRGINYSSVPYNDVERFKEILSKEKGNMVIPSSGSETALKNITSKLRSYIRDMEGVSVTLFGYPEWQTLTAKYDSQLKMFNSVFYTTFFSNPNNINIQRFNRAFEKWFNRPQIVSYPKYAELGFDIANYFIRGLHEKGSKFSSATPVAYEGMQTAFNFRTREEGSAAFNNSVMFVRINNDNSYTVDR